MLAFLQGRLAAVDKEAVTIEVSGLGFQLQVPASTLERLPALGSEIKLHTYLAVREEGLALYGFWGQDELAIFRSLLNVGGVGPKAALGLLS
ncbi:MAG: Holliday junction branch migration protein RuvA, partial [Moorella sp. (in: Bacteria)]|nr:Holliday junction branch migration protein RuvA [Moorella sp. (in: firmicutes)]